MSPSDDGGYVHDPSTFDEGGKRTKTAGGSDPPHPDSTDREFDWRGWTLVGVIVFAFLVAPTAIYLFPPGAEGYRFALLILPLAPAVLLAVAAVWATTRP
ncbi:hypothetical protein [Natrinema sp. 74]|uniref:hypothetical protein n=1 Tax=Natrinema sp. 74 TaxID=3384159 RepID=UPI0038D47FE2